ncbi:hypothetical protein LCGC14_1141140 [marine sediment metagenome]|uniref:Uncharacterized protein n=1 Tax=marine sediment metagenome TaxID=412755 RepID=A0A0F9PGF0_9ZZZZ
MGFLFGSSSPQKVFVPSASAPGSGAEKAATAKAAAEERARARRRRGRQANILTGPLGAPLTTGQTTLRSLLGG